MVRYEHTNQVKNSSSSTEIYDYFIKYNYFSYKKIYMRLKKQLITGLIQKLGNTYGSDHVLVFLILLKIHCTMKVLLVIRFNVFGNFPQCSISGKNNSTNMVPLKAFSLVGLIKCV